MKNLLRSILKLYNLLVWEKKYRAYCKTHTKYEFEGYCWVCQKCVEDILSDSDWSSYSDDSYDSEFKYLIYIYMYD